MRHDGSDETNVAPVLPLLSHRFTRGKTALTPLDGRA